MKNLLIVGIALILYSLPTHGQTGKDPLKNAKGKSLTPIEVSILEAQRNIGLYILNLDDHSRENNVNAIVLDFQRYIDSLPANKTQEDVLLLKNYAPLRLFFLTTTNKTTVATSFLYSSTPYKFCQYRDTTALFFSAIKNGETYDLSTMTPKWITNLALTNCMLPAIKAVAGFGDSEIKYVGLAIYFGCKDSRLGAPKGRVSAYCLSLVARVADIKQYADGLITEKGLLAVSTIYLSGEDDYKSLHEVSLDSVVIIAE